MNIVVETKELSKSYKMGELTIEVLRGINIRIKQGEFVSIMGPSGSGKSTLLYLLGGLDKPTSGSINVNGQELNGMEDRDESRLRRRTIGFVFQFYNLIPNLTVEENILLPVVLDGKKTRQYKDKLDEILETVELAERRRHTPAELSGGQQQRVAIARSLINDPEIILADEPTGNLDSSTSEKILGLFQRINLERNKTIIQVTHALEAAAYGTRVVRLKDGRVCEE